MNKEDLKKFNLLVVEDEELLRKAVAYDFKRAGFTVIEAENGKMAFEVVKSTPIHMVLSDIRMPEGDGVSMLEKIRAEYPEVPLVVFMTGFAEVSEQECLDKGARKVFAKPFNRKELLQYVIDSLTKTQAA